MLGLVIDKQKRAYDILWSFYPLLHIFLEKKIKNKKESRDVLSHPHLSQILMLKEPEQ